jgi:hypothetical protein
MTGSLVATLASISGVSAASFEKLHDFTCPTEKQSPVGGVRIEADGSVVGGTRSDRGAAATYAGTLYRLSPPAVAGRPWTFSRLFTLQTASGPLNGELTRDVDGNLVGGTDTEIFKLVSNPVAATGWSKSILHKFTASSPIGGPGWTLQRWSDGAFYGATSKSPNQSGYGGIFRLKPPEVAGRPWSLEVLHVASTLDGGSPRGKLKPNSQGIIYGTTGDASRYEHSDQECPDSYCPGSDAFALLPPATAGGKWTYRVLRRVFPVSLGASLVPDDAGNLYGTTFLPLDTQTAVGQVVRLEPPAPGHVGWPMRTLYAPEYSSYDPYWTDPIGDSAVVGLLKGTDGALYGARGGGNSNFNLGGVFALTPPAAGGTRWNHESLHIFPRYDSNARVSATNYRSAPVGNLTMARDGWVYGVSYGGAKGCGYVYRVRK